MPDIPSYVISPRQVLGRVSVIIGKSGSGKTTIVKDFINSISNDIEQAFVISQTAEVNGDYSGIIPEVCIHKHIDIDFLKEIQERQEAFRVAYENINEPSLINGLFRRCASDRISAKIAKINEEIARSIAEIKKETRNTEEDIKKLESMKDDLIAAIKKKTISDSRERLYSQSLTEAEKYCVDHIFFNPNLLLIFDDCTSEIEALKNKPEFKEIFYASRHRKITVLMIAHTDKALLGDLKKSAAFLIFTDKGTANSYFDRKTNDIDNGTKRLARGLISTVIGTPDDPEPLRHQRLVFSNGKFYKYTAIISPPRCIVAPILQKYCEAVRAAKGDGLANNKYAKLLI